MLKERGEGDQEIGTFDNRVLSPPEGDVLEDAMMTGFGPGTSGNVNIEAMVWNSISNSSRRARYLLFLMRSVCVKNVKGSDLEEWKHGSE